MPGLARVCGQRAREASTHPLVDAREHVNHLTKETVTVQTLRTLVFGLTLLASALTLLPQPVAAQSINSIPFAAQLVPAPHCSATTTTSFAFINADRSVRIVIVGLRCGGRFVTGHVTIKALQVRLTDGQLFEAGAVSTTLIRGNGAFTAPAGGGALLAHCGTDDPSGTFGTTCQSLIIVVEDQKGVVQAGTGVQ